MIEQPKSTYNLIMGLKLKAVLMIFLAIFISKPLFAQMILQKVTYSKQELEHGKKIYQLLKQVKLNRLNLALAKRLNKSLKDKASTFRPYRAWVQDVISVYQVSKLQNFSSCENILNKKYEDNLYQPLNKYCYLKFINIYQNASGQLFKKYQHLFERYLPYYLFPLKKYFVNFLKKISNKKDFSIMVSNKTLQAYSGGSYSGKQ